MFEAGQRILPELNSAAHRSIPISPVGRRRSCWARRVPPRRAPPQRSEASSQPGVPPGSSIRNASGTPPARTGSNPAGRMSRSMTLAASRRRSRRGAPLASAVVRRRTLETLRLTFPGTSCCDAVSACALMSVMNTVALAAENARAISRPMPEAAPVMRTRWLMMTSKKSVERNAPYSGRGRRRYAHSSVKSEALEPRDAASITPVERRCVAAPCTHE